MSLVSRRCALATVAIFLSCCAIGASQTPGGGNVDGTDEPATRFSADWSYVGEGPARMLSVQTSEAKPADLIEHATYEGSVRSYSEIIYGAPGSGRVAIVLDRLAPREFNLYIDLNRDRTIGNVERVGKGGNEWTINLPRATSSDLAPEFVNRKLRLRRGRLSLSLGTVGFVEGHLRLDDRIVVTRRIDGDRDGLFTSARDEIWFDLDQDGEFSAINERFPFRPVFVHDDQRWLIKSELAGEELSAEPLEGSGQLQLAMPALSEGTKLESIETMFVGDDGSAIGIASATEPVTVPAGQYSLHSLSCSFVEEKTQRRWSFVFSRYGEPRWHSIAEDQTLAINPIGKLDFSINHKIPDAGISPGATINVRPRLQTEEGLDINSCECRDVDEQPSFFSRRNGHCAELLLQVSGASTETASSYSSGFA